MKTHKKILLSTAAIAGLTLVAGGVYAANPYAKPNQADITITGDVISQVGDEFTLDYGEGIITVEMDDWDWHNEAAYINPGETVTVRGEIDDDLYQIKTIEADSVYVFERATYYYASDTDEEDSAYWTFSYYDPATAPEGTWFGLSGTVTKVTGSEFTLDTGYNKMQIETAYLGYNPLDDVGYQQVDPGDRVYVTGDLDRNFFTKNEIDANSIITLAQDTTKTVKSPNNSSSN